MSNAKLTEAERLAIAARSPEVFGEDINNPAQSIPNDAAVVYVVNPATITGDITVGDVGLLNAADVAINPATKEEQEAAKLILAQIRDANLNELAFHPVRAGAAGDDTDPLYIGVYRYTGGTTPTGSPLGGFSADGTFTTTLNNPRFVVGGAAVTPSTDFEYADYKVTTAHSGLAVGDLVRERITEAGNTWALLQGSDETALPGADPTYDNLERIGGGSTATTDNATERDLFTVNAGVTGTGYSAGNVLRRLQFWNTKVTPATLTETKWENLSTGTDLTTPPEIAGLTPGGATVVSLGSTGVTIPEPGDAAIAATATAIGRPAAGDPLLTVPATADWVGLVFYANAISTIPQRGTASEAFTLMGDGGRYRADGTAPDLSITADTVDQSVFWHGMTIVLPRAEAIAMQALCNSVSTATVDQRYRVQAFFYSGGQAQDIQALLPAFTPLPDIPGGETSGAVTAESSNITAISSNLTQDGLLVAANDLRSKVLVTNKTGAQVAISQGSAASVAAGGYSYLLPNNASIQDTYRGEIRFIAEAGATGYLNVAEYTRATDGEGARVAFLTSFAAGFTASQQALGPSAARKEAIFHNNTDASAFVREGYGDAAVAATGYTLEVAPGVTVQTTFLGPISFIAPNATTGYINVTERA